MLETSDLNEPRSSDHQILLKVVRFSNVQYLTDTPARSEDLASALEQGVLENDVVALNSSREHQHEQ